MTLNQITDLTEPSELLVDFGDQPVSNRFLCANSTEKAPSFPLQLRINQASGLIYIANPFPVEEIKPCYDWLTCYEPEDHLDNLVQRLITLPGITASSVFGAFSFKDDTTLRRLERMGYANTWRIDPLEDLGVSDPCANVETYQGVLTRDVAKKISDRNGASDVFIVRHVLEHTYDLCTFIDAIRLMVRPQGYIVWEIPDCGRALDAGDCTTIWEEHTFYFTAHTFKQLLLKFGFSIEHYESVPYTLENSLLAIVKGAGSVCNSKASEDTQALAKEIIRAKSFIKICNRRKVEIRQKLIALKQEKGLIAMFGAGHLSVAFISLMQVADLICCVIDDNPNKKGLQMPVGELQIVSSEVLYSKDIRVCLLGLNPQNQSKVISNHQRFTDKGGTFLSIFPDSKLGMEHI
jgi:hypothetical protein